MATRWIVDYLSDLSRFAGAPGHRERPRPASGAGGFRLNGRAPVTLAPAGVMADPVVAGRDAAMASMDGDMRRAARFGRAAGLRPYVITSGIDRPVYCLIRARLCAA